MTKQEYNQILNELQIFLDSKTPEEFDKYLDDLDSEYTINTKEGENPINNLSICLSPITINFNNSDDLLFTNNDLFGKGA